MSCRAAYKWWSEALDALIGVQNAVHVWISVLKNSLDMSADLLKRCGLWGCLLAAIISSNIAQSVPLTLPTALSINLSKYETFSKLQNVAVRYLLYLVKET